MHCGHLHGRKPSIPQGRLRVARRASTARASGGLGHDLVAARSQNPDDGDEQIAECGGTGRHDRERDRASVEAEAG